MVKTIVVPSLNAVVEQLIAFHDPPLAPPSTDPFELILFENVAYLALDARRREAFELLRQTIGTSPQALLDASQKSLESVTSRGILKGTSAEKLRLCAQIAMEEFDGDLRQVVEEPARIAKRALQRFPGIGEPGAEKILLFCADQPFLAPDSNGLRVLARVGLIPAQDSYARAYASARPLAAALGNDPARLQAAHAMLRLHGQTICKRSTPECGACPLLDVCAFGRALALTGKTGHDSGHNSGT